MPIGLSLARLRKTKGGIKLLTLLGLNVNTPSFLPLLWLTFINSTTLLNTSRSLVSFTQWTVARLVTNLMNM